MGDKKERERLSVFRIIFFHVPPAHCEPPARHSFLFARSERQLSFLLHFSFSQGGMPDSPQLSLSLSLFYQFSRVDRTRDREDQRRKTVFWRETEQEGNGGKRKEKRKESVRNEMDELNCTFSVSQSSKERDDGGEMPSCPLPCHVRVPDERVPRHR